MLCIDSILVSTLCGITIMNGTKGMASLMSDHLPLGGGLRNDVRTTHSLSVPFVDIVDASLAEPGKSNFSTRGAVGQQGPKGVTIVSPTTPF